MSDTMELIKDQIENNPVILYMKGSPDAPQCGFSSKASQAVMAAGERFALLISCRILKFEALFLPMLIGRLFRSCG